MAAAATAAAAEVAAASKAAAAPEAAAKAAAAANKRKAFDVPTPKKKPDLRKEPGGGAGPVDGEDSFERAAVFGVGELVRVLPATAPGYLPRLAEGCGEGHVTAFDPIKREYTVKPLALYSRQQTQIPEDYVVAPSQDGTKEMYSRGGALSSEGAKAVVQAERRTAEFEKISEQLRLKTERTEHD